MRLIDGKLQNSDNFSLSMVLMTSLPIMKNGRFLVFLRVTFSTLLLKDHFILEFDIFGFGMFVDVHAPIASL